MRLPPDWTPVKASGWWVLHHLKHEPCGWQSALAYDLIISDSEARQVVYGHRCEGDDA